MPSYSLNEIQRLGLLHNRDGTPIKSRPAIGIIAKKIGTTELETHAGRFAKVLTDEQIDSYNANALFIPKTVN